MITTALLTHSTCLGHETPAGHPESVDRLRAVLSGLQGDEFMLLLREQAPEATLEQLSAVHPREFVDAILKTIPATGFAYIDGDTPVSPGSGKAALHAAGAVVRGVDLVMQEKARNVFCAVRPPGHHAGRNRAMGFCLFNNVAVGAQWARMNWGLNRVAVVDFDVHHGNGTQDIFERDAGVFFASTHQAPLYPYTGAASETGAHRNVVNAPLPAGADGAMFRAVMQDRILPELDAFQPELILISAGFDAHRADPLAGLNFLDEDFGWATRAIIEVADTHSKGRVVSTLEGGYDLAALAASVRAHIRALMGV